MSEMKLWLFTNIEGAGYDEYEGAVVRAKTEQEARTLVSSEIGDYPDQFPCVELTTDGESELILAAFHAG